MVSESCLFGCSSHFFNSASCFQFLHILSSSVTELLGWGNTDILVTSGLAMLKNNIDILANSCSMDGMVMDGFSHGKMGLICKEDMCLDDGGERS